MEEKHWYAVYTKPRWEKKVAALLVQQGLEGYCPLNRCSRQWSDRKKTVEIPLFTSYVFVRIDEEEKDAIRRTPGILNFVYWNGKPAVLRNEEIEAIRDFVTANENIVLTSLKMEVGATIEIPEGVFKGQTGEVLKIEKKRVEILLHQLGIKLTVIV